MKTTLFFAIIFFIFYHTISHPMQHHQQTQDQIAALIAAQEPINNPEYTILSDNEKRIHPDIANSSLPYVPFGAYYSLQDKANYLRY